MTTVQQKIYFSPGFYNSTPKCVLGSSPQKWVLGSSPQKCVEELNEKIFNFRPKKALIQLVCIVAFSVLLIGGVGTAVAFGAASSYVLLTLPIYSIATIVAVQDYKGFCKEYADIVKDIKKVPIGPFTFIDQTFSNGNLSEQDFEKIKKYFLEDYILEDSIALNVEEIFDCVVSRGQISSWSIQPLSYKEKFRKNNLEKVLAKYGSWIDLLLHIEGSTLSDSQKKQMGQLVGFMIHKPPELTIKMKETEARIGSRENPNKVYYFYQTRVENPSGVRKPYICKIFQGHETYYSSVKEFAQELPFDPLNQHALRIG